MFNVIAWTERCGSTRTKFGEPWIFSPDLVALKVWAGLQQQQMQWRSVWSSHKLVRCEVRLRHPKTAIRTLMLLLLSQLLPSSTNVPTATESIISGSGRQHRVQPAYSSSPVGHKAASYFCLLLFSNPAIQPPPHLTYFPSASKTPEPQVKVWVLCFFCNVSHVFPPRLSHFNIGTQLPPSQQGMRRWWDPRRQVV